MPSFDGCRDLVVVGDRHVTVSGFVEQVADGLADVRLVLYEEHHRPHLRTLGGRVGDRQLPHARTFPGVARVTTLPRRFCVPGPAAS